MSQSTIPSDGVSPQLTDTTKEILQGEESAVGKLFALENIAAGIQNTTPERLLVSYATQQRGETSLSLPTECKRELRELESESSDQTFDFDAETVIREAEITDTDDLYAELARLSTVYDSPTDAENTLLSLITAADGGGIEFDSQQTITVIQQIGPATGFSKAELEAQVDTNSQQGTSHKSQSSNSEQESSQNDSEQAETIGVGTEVSQHPTPASKANQTQGENNKQQPDQPSQGDTDETQTGEVFDGTEFQQAEDSAARTAPDDSPGSAQKPETHGTQSADGKTTEDQGESRYHSHEITLPEELLDHTQQDSSSHPQHEADVQENDSESTGSEQAQTSLTDLSLLSDTQGQRTEAPPDTSSSSTTDETGTDNSDKRTNTEQESSGDAGKTPTRSAHPTSTPTQDSSESSKNAQPDPSTTPDAESDTPTETEQTTQPHFFNDTAQPQQPKESSQNSHDATQSPRQATQSSTEDPSNQSHDTATGLQSSTQDEGDQEASSNEGLSERWVRQNSVDSTADEQSEHQQAPADSQGENTIEQDPSKEQPQTQAADDPDDMEVETAVSHGGYPPKEAEKRNNSQAETGASSGTLHGTDALGSDEHQSGTETQRAQTGQQRASPTDDSRRDSSPQPGRESKSPWTETQPPEKEDESGAHASAGTIPPQDDTQEKDSHTETRTRNVRTGRLAQEVPDSNSTPAGNRTQEFVELEYVFDKDDQYSPDGCSTHGIVKRNKKEYTGIIRVTPQSWSVHEPDEQERIAARFVNNIIGPLEHSAKFVQLETPEKGDKYLDELEKRHKQALNGDRDENQVFSVKRQVRMEWLNSLLEEAGITSRDMFVTITVTPESVMRYENQTGVMDTLAELPAIGRLFDRFTVDPHKQVSNADLLAELDTRLTQLTSDLTEIGLESTRITDRQEALRVIYKDINRIDPPGPFGGREPTQIAQQASKSTAQAQAENTRSKDRHRSTEQSNPTENRQSAQQRPRPAEA